MIEKNSIMSPIQTWQGYDAVKEDTEVSIINYELKDDIITTEIIYTVANVEDGKIRGYLKLAKRMDANCASVILVVPNYDGTEEIDVYNDVINEGFVYATIEYAGVGEKHTEYPNSCYYGNFESIENIIEVKGSPKKTCWYLWDMVLKRAMTVINEQIPNARICLLGADMGANICWQVAGMDNRVNCFISVNGSGYIETMKKYYKPVIAGDYPTAWLAGVAPQAYAKYVTCPVLYVGGSNNMYSNIDKVQEIMALSSSKDKYMTICQNSEKKITLESYNTIKLWVDRFFLKAGGSIKETEVNFSNSDGRLYIKVKAYEQVKNIAIFVAKKETNFSIREWNLVNNYTALENGEYIVPIDVESVDDIIYCYVNSYYEDGLVLSSKPIAVVPKEIGIEEATAVKKSSSRIVYNTSMVDDYFYGENKKAVFDRRLIVKKEGAFTVKGIGLEGGGSLYTFRVGDNKYRSAINATLKMDAYTLKDTTFEVVVYNLEQDELVPYKVPVFLKQSDKWQQISLTVTDFKNYEMISLESFSNIKKIELKDIDTVIFNNIIWV